MDAAKNSIEEWVALIAPLAAKLQPNPAKRAAAVAGGMQVLGKHAVEAGKVQQWLTGQEIPRDAMTHATLMKALGLPESEQELAFEITGPRLQKAQMRTRIDDAWQEALETVRLRPELPLPVEAKELPMRLRKPRPPNEQIVSNPQKAYIQDHPSLPKRDPRALCGYNLLEREQLKDILANTGNAAEFFAVFLQLHYPTETHQFLAEKIGYVDKSAIGAILYGRSLPSQSRLQAIQQKLMQPYSAADAAHFEDLVIDNRLRVIHHELMKKQPSGKIIGNTLEFMPVRYWNFLLEQLDSSKESGDHKSAPLWIEKALLITTQGDYLRALCGSNGKSSRQVSMESGYNQSSLTTLFHQKLEISEWILSYADQHLPGFDRAQVEALPEGRSLWLPELSPLKDFRRSVRQSRANRDDRGIE